MKLEASQAHVENERIHREFDIREAKTEALIRQQQQSYDLLMRLRIELDMMTIATDIQEKNILKAIQQNQKTERLESRYKLCNAEIVTFQRLQGSNHHYYAGATVAGSSIRFGYRIQGKTIAGARNQTCSSTLSGPRKASSHP